MADVAAAAGTPTIWVRQSATPPDRRLEGTMLVVGGTFEVDLADRDAFIAARHESMRTSRGEKGCLEYTFAADPLDPGRVILFERWEDQEALDAHLSALRERPQPSSPGPTAASIVIYEISGERRLV
jgi:quinol monooxygenase YgiN